MTIDPGEIAAGGRHGTKQRAPVGLTKAPVRRKCPLSQGNMKGHTSEQAIVLGPAALRLMEEEKKAVRRHRKRLAKIVVDQWRYFARKALLALEFQRRVLDRRKAQCWEAWKAAVSKRRLKWTQQARAEARRRLFLEHQVLIRWRDHVQKQKKYQEAAARLLWMDARRTYRIAFDALRAHRTASYFKRQANDSALCYWRLSTLSRFLHRWSAATKAGQKGMAQRVKALQHWSAWRKRMAFRVWRQVCLTQKEHRRVAEVLRERQEGRRKRETLSLWHLALSAKREEDAKLDKAYSFQYMRLVNKSLRQWTLFLELRKERRLEEGKANEKAARHFEHQLGTRGLRAWQLYCENRRRKHERLEAADAENLLRIKRLAFQKWRSYLQAKRDKWAKADLARKFAERHLKGRFMLALRLGVQRKRQKEQHAIVAGRHWVRHVKKTALARWRAVTLAARLEREATEEMLEEKKMVMVRAWQRDFHLSKGIYSWQLYVESQRLSRSQHSKASRFLRAKLLLKALAGFRMHLAKRKERREQKHMADEAFRKALLGRVLLVCWREALFRRRAKQEAYRQADSLRDSRLRQVSLEVWRVRTAKWALKSTAMRRAALHYENALLKRGLQAWTQCQNSRRQKRHAEDERVEGLRRELGVLVAGRVLAAWVEQHDQRLVRKLKTASARGHIREVYERQGLRVWRDWLEKRRAKQGKQELAERLCKRLLLKRAVAAWKTHLGKVRGKKELDARALKHWGGRLQQRAMQEQEQLWVIFGPHMTAPSCQAWTSYLAERRLKNVSMTSADRLYQKHLVHKTASHWLAKARRRQQLRLQIALEKQALTSIAQLARVAPFARRWRHLARRRREEREGGRQRALLDGWAVRNVSSSWRNLSKTRPPTGWMFRSGLEGGTRVQSLKEQTEITRRTADSVKAASDVTLRNTTVPLRERASNVLGAPSSLLETSRSERVQVAQPVSHKEDHPVASVVERITASIASGASVLDALPLWARVHSRPPPRRPAHLLTAGLPPVKRRLTAGKADAVESRVKASTWADTNSQAGPNGVPFSSEAKGLFGSSRADLLSSESQHSAESFREQTRGFLAAAEPHSRTFDGGEEYERARTPEFRRPKDREASQMVGGRSAVSKSNAAVSRQLMLGGSDNRGTKTVRVGTAQTIIASESHTAALLTTTGMDSNKDSKAEETRPASVGGTVSSSRVTLDPRIIAQEVTWMEQVLLEFDNLKLESLKCSAELGALRGTPESSALVAETNGGTSTFLEDVNNVGGLRSAERIWELEQRHAALELRKKLQLPMVRAVAERIRTLALSN